MLKNQYHQTQRIQKQKIQIQKNKLLTKEKALRQLRRKLFQDQEPTMCSLNLVLTFTTDDITLFSCIKLNLLIRQLNIFITYQCALDLYVLARSVKKS